MSTINFLVQSLHQENTCKCKLLPDLWEIVYSYAICSDDKIEAYNSLVMSYRKMEIEMEQFVHKVNDRSIRDVETANDFSEHDVDRMLSELNSLLIGMKRESSDFIKDKPWERASYDEYLPLLQFCFDEEFWGERPLAPVGEQPRPLTKERFKRGQRWEKDLNPSFLSLEDECDIRRLTVEHCTDTKEQRLQRLPINCNVITFFCEVSAYDDEIFESEWFTAYERHVYLLCCAMFDTTCVMTMHITLVKDPKYNAPRRVDLLPKCGFYVDVCFRHPETLREIEYRESLAKK